MSTQPSCMPACAYRAHGPEAATHKAMNTQYTYSIHSPASNLKAIVHASVSVYRQTHAVRCLREHRWADKLGAWQMDSKPSKTPTVGTPPHPIQDTIDVCHGACSGKPRICTHRAIPETLAPRKSVTSCFWTAVDPAARSAAELQGAHGGGRPLWILLSGVFVLRLLNCPIVLA